MNTHDRPPTHFRDVLLEARISLAGRRDLNNPENLLHLVELIRQRSPEQIARLEKRMGLEK